MSVKFSVIPKSNPNDHQAPRQFYPSIQARGRVTARELAEMIARISTVSRIDAMAMLEALLILIPEQLQAGNIVELGEFGSFRLRIKSEGSPEYHQVSRRNIIQVRPLFHAGKEFKKILSQTRFEKINGQ